MTPNLELLKHALRSLAGLDGIRAVLKPTENAGRADKTPARVEFRWRKRKATYSAVVQRPITRATVGTIALDFKSRQQDVPMLLVGEYITPELADTLREMEVQFLDTHGNAYIRTEWCYIFVRGRKTAQTVHTRTRTTIFGWAGLKVGFALLCSEEARRANYRWIAEAAGVAIGTVAGVMQDLQHAGYLREGVGGAVRLRNGRELLNRWVMAYTEKLRQKQLIGRYSANTPLDLEVVRQCGAFAGGETAAWALQRHLRPGVETIYVRGETAEIIARLRLREDPSGTVELRRNFWTFDYPEKKQVVVPPLLIYGDLLAIGDPRTIEAAGMIFDTYLDRHFREA